VVLLLVASVCSHTTLQEALTTAFVENVQAGIWRETFGVHRLVVGDTCSPPSTDYPYPLEAPGSDLYDVLQSGEFVCSYPHDVKIYAPDGAIVLDTTYNNASGLMVDFFQKLIDTLSIHYQKDIKISWSTNFDDYSDALNAVISGDASAACGYYNPGGTISYRNSIVPRSSELSLFNCFSFVQSQVLYSLQTPLEFPISNWNALISQINILGTGFVVCTTGSTVNSDISEACTSAIAYYSFFSNYTCTPVGDLAFSYLQDGACDVVWGGPYSSPPIDPSNSYVPFVAPIYFAAGSFFRLEDL